MASNEEESPKADDESIVNTFIIQFLTSFATFPALYILRVLLNNRVRISNSHRVAGTYIDDALISGLLSVLTDKCILQHALQRIIT